MSEQITPKEKEKENSKEKIHIPVLTTNMISLLMTVSDLYERKPLDDQREQSDLEITF